MEPAAQQDPKDPNYYCWEIPGKPVAVHLHLDVVDRLATEVQRGFGAVPKRGAEVGGLLLGSVEPGEVTVVRIVDFEAVPCTYSRGPSYLFSEDERTAFDEAYNRWQADVFGTGSAVGFFRSHTREGMSLTPEDLELMHRYFPGPAQVALLIRPYATKVSTAGFFVREAGKFPAVTPLEFPFRRAEITGVPPAPRRVPTGPRRTETSLRLDLQAELERIARPPASSNPLPSPAREEDAEEPAEIAEPRVASQSPPRRSFFEFTPLAPLLLLLGLIVGFGAALQFAPLFPAGSALKEFGLNLAVVHAGDNLTVRWNRDAKVLRSAQRGVLEIEDGGFAKPVELDVAHLRDGSVIYQNTSGVVRFRFTVYVDQRLTVTETLEWRQ